MWPYLSGWTASQRFARACLAAAMVLFASPLTAQDWSRYAAPGVVIDVPTRSFVVVSDEGGRLRLSDAERGAELQVFGGRNVQGLSVAAFRQAVESADPSRDITYRAAGNSWFVISGHMTDPESADGLIYYAKFIFSTDRSQFAAFEISYPRRLKQAFDRVLERLEESLSVGGR